MVKAMVWVLVAALAQAVSAGPAAADERGFRLVADTSLHRSGLLDYLLPRFSLKTSIPITVLPPEDFDPAMFADAPADLAALVPADAVGAGFVPPPQVAFLAAGDDGAPGAGFLVIAPGAGPDQPARVFVDWLLSPIGQNTVAAYQPDGVPVFLPRPDRQAAAEPEMPKGDVVLGEKLALLHCGRCHVVNARNRMGGIGSTPSFGALRSLPEWQTRFLTFWSLNPHPSFTQVTGITEPFDMARPPHIAPVEITREDLEAILAFAATIVPKNLGAPIEAR